MNRNVLRALNEKRRLHGVPRLGTAPRLAAGAQKWAEALAKSGKAALSKLGSDRDADVAELLADPVKGKDNLGITAVDRWYKTGEKYDFDKPGFQQASHQFT